jgi:nitrogen-specific signal transduction histidine kinase/CheY-like chemotaxis protein
LADAGDLRLELDEARARIATLEAELAAARRLATAARLTDSVAHDFGNVLAAIAGYNDLMLRSLAAGSPLRRGAESIQKAVQWGHRLARQLLTTGRVPADPPSADLNAVVAGVVRTLGPILGERIVVDLRLDPGAGAVGVGAAALEQVTMNLVLNARDAMPSGGRLTVTTALAPGNGHGRAAMPTLSVEDTGIGMDEATRARVFEPYFTTKPTGRGTGLGLSTVFGILRQHGGEIDVSSEPGHGSTFRVGLPASAPAGPATAPARAAPAVLVVEDEPGVCDVVVEILEASGYRALRAGSAEEALGLCARDPGGVAVVLADLAAPGVAGPELAEWLRALAPEARIVYLSDEPERAGADRATLAKPFSVEALVQTVRSALGEPDVTGSGGDAGNRADPGAGR